jgi:hypothetical protein
MTKKDKERKSFNEELFTRLEKLIAHLTIFLAQYRDIEAITNDIQHDAKNAQLLSQHWAFMLQFEPGFPEWFFLEARKEILVETLRNSKPALDRITAIISDAMVGDVRN